MDYLKDTYFFLPPFKVNYFSYREVRPSFSNLLSGNYFMDRILSIH